jgi:hypothetical protein
VKAVVDSWTLDEARMVQWLLREAIPAKIKAEEARRTALLQPGFHCLYSKGVFTTVPTTTKRCGNCDGFYTRDDKPCPHCGID